MVDYFRDEKPEDVLEQLIDYKVVSVLKVLFSDKEKQFYLKETSEEAVVPMATTYRILQKLKGLSLLDEIKIDKSFVMNMANDKKDVSIVKAAIDLAHNLDLTIVAEGVEDEKTFDLLTEMGCDYAQGYYMAKPMPCDDLMLWMQDSKWS